MTFVDGIKVWASTPTSPRENAAGELTNSQRTYQEKVALYRDLTEALTDLETKGETRRLDEWQARFEAASKEGQKTSELQVKAITELMRDKTALSVAEIRALSDVTRAQAAKRAGASSTDEDFWRKMLMKDQSGSDQNVADPSRLANPSDPTVKARILSVLQSRNEMDVTSKRRPYITARALQEGLWTPQELEQLLGPELWAAYIDNKVDADAGAGIAGIADRLVAGTFSKPDLDKLKDEAKLYALVAKEDVTMPERVVSPLETALGVQREALAEDIQVGPSAPVRGPWGGLTDEQVGEIVSRPGFQRWAKAHKLSEIGYVNADGAFVPGADTFKALRLASKQSMQPADKVVGEFEGRVAQPAKPQMIINGGVTNGIVQSVWLPQDDGSVDYLDLESGKLTPAKDANGFWRTNNLRDLYAKQAEGQTPHPVGIKGEPAWSYEQIKAAGPLDSMRTELTNEADELLTTPPPVVGIKGGLRIPTFGEDPDYDATVEQADGTVVRLHRATTTEPWSVASGKLHVPVEQFDLSRGKVVKPDRMVRDALALARKGAKPTIDEQVAALDLKTNPDDIVVERTPVEPTEAEIDAFRFPDKPVDVVVESAEPARPRILPKAKSEVTEVAVLDSPALAADEAALMATLPLTSAQKVDITKRVESRSMGDELESGGRAMVADAKVESERAAKLGALTDAERKKALARAPGRQAEPAAPIAKADVNAYDEISPALAADEAEFMANFPLSSRQKVDIAKRVEARALGDELEADGIVAVAAAKAERARNDQITAMKEDERKKAESARIVVIPTPKTFVAKPEPTEAEIDALTFDTDPNKIVVERTPMAADALRLLRKKAG